MKVRFLRPADWELREALNYYDSQKPGLGDDFLDELQKTLERVVNFPKAHPRVGEAIRRARTHRFPYSLLYKMYKDEIVIIAVMHDSRKPDFWKNRL